MTFLRVWNFFQLRLSYYLSRVVRKPIHWGLPVAISIEPTTACNLHCPQCPSGLRQFTRPTGNLKPDVNKIILQKFGNRLQYINYYFQGEPFINSHITELFKEARRRNIYTITSTNAHFISSQTAHQIVDSGLHELIISIDGTTQQTYENYRVEGKLEKVLEGINHLVEAKRMKQSALPLITFQFLVTRQNEHQLPEIKKLADELGADRLTLKTVQVYDVDNAAELIPENEKFARYRINEDGKPVLKNKFRNSCWRSWSSCVVTWDAKIVPCCFDKDAKYQFGNLLEQNLQDAWKNTIAADFQQKILTDRKQIDICRNCSEGSKIWI